VEFSRQARLLVVPNDVGLGKNEESSVRVTSHLVPIESKGWPLHVTELVRWGKPRTKIESKLGIFDLKLSRKFQLVQDVPLVSFAFVVTPFILGLLASPNPRLMRPYVKMSNSVCSLLCTSNFLTKFFESRCRFNAASVKEAWLLDRVDRERSSHYIHPVLYLSNLNPDPKPVS
jgi:hypothetical protein